MPYFKKKLTQEQVDEIRRLSRDEGVRHADLAAQFGVTAYYVNLIVCGRVWKRSFRPFVVPRQLPANEQSVRMAKEAQRTIALIKTERAKYEEMLAVLRAENRALVHHNKMLHRRILRLVRHDVELRAQLRVYYRRLQYKESEKAQKVVAKRVEWAKRNLKPKGPPPIRFSTVDALLDSLENGKMESAE